jgi:hypothetical protein
VQGKKKKVKWKVNVNLEKENRSIFIISFASQNKFRSS